MASSSAVQKDRQLELATQSKSKSRFEAFRRFVSEHKTNPASNEKIVVAKDLSFPRGESEDSLTVLVPLAVKEYFLYLGSYIDPKTELVEYCIRISALSDLTPNGAQTCGGHAVYSFSDAKARKNDNVRMSKGSRYVPFFATYFDDKKNKELFRNGRNASTVIPVAKKYDTDKEEYQDVCGYVELHHQRVPIRGKSQAFVQLISCASYKGQRKNARLVNLLAAELPLIAAYMKFVTRVYKLDDASYQENVEERYRESGRQDVVEALQRLDELRAKSGGSSKKDGDDAAVGVGARKRKATGKTSKTGAVKQTRADGSNEPSAEEDEECADARPIKSKKRTGKNKRLCDDEKENLESLGEKKKRSKTTAKNPFETGNCEAPVSVDGEEEEEDEEDGEKGKNDRLEIDCLQDEEDEEDEEDYAADENEADGVCV